MEKHAVLSMDVEDWYHLYYFLGKADRSKTMLDGFLNYIELMNKNNILFLHLRKFWKFVINKTVLVTGICGMVVIC